MNAYAITAKNWRGIPISYIAIAANEGEAKDKATDQGYTDVTVSFVEAAPADWVAEPGESA